MISRAKKVVVVMGADPFAYRKAWLHTIYVAPTGNDTTGNGSKAAPYLTLTKALAVAVAGDGILLANGTYPEKSGAGAAGYLTISKNLANWLIIEPELGAAGSVTITGTAGADINIYFTPATTSAYLKFRYLNFSMCAGSTTLMRSAAALSNIVFDRCTLTPIDGAILGFYHAGGAINGLTFTGCTINKPGTATSYFAVRLTTSVNTTNILFDGCTLRGSDDTGGTPGRGVYATGTLGGVCTFNNCTISGGDGFAIPTGGTVTFTGCTINCVASCLAGADGSGADQTAELALVVVNNSTINKNIAVAGHALLFGYGANNSSADNVTIPAAYDYAVVVKENTGIEIQNCHLTGGGSSALLYKAAVSANAHHNVLTGTGTVGAFQLRNGDNPAHHCATWQFQNNTVNVTGASKCLVINNSDHDNGGGICDYNTYQNNSGLGIVRNDIAVANLTELQAAWGDYDVTTNDSHSTVV